MLRISSHIILYDAYWRRQLVFLTAHILLNSCNCSLSSLRIKKCWQVRSTMIITKCFYALSADGSGYLFASYKNEIKREQQKIVTAKDSQNLRKSAELLFVHAFCNYSDAETVLLTIQISYLLGKCWKKPSTLLKRIHDENRRSAFQFLDVWSIPNSTAFILLLDSCIRFSWKYMLLHSFSCNVLSLWCFDVSKIIEFLY